MNTNKLNQCRSFSDVSVYVLGDSILDVYVQGECNRISREAPIPVMNIQSECSMPGGAANVVMNLKSLGATKIYLSSACGDDHPGEILRKHVHATGILDDWRIPEYLNKYDYQTTVKTRYVVDNKQVFCTEQSTPYASNKDIRLSSLTPQPDVIILSDYGRGFLSDNICRKTIKFANAHKIPVVVDPRCKDWSKYAGAFCIKPNRQEFEEAIGEKIDLSTPSGTRRLEGAAVDLCCALNVKSLLVTLGQDGMVYIANGKATYVESKAKDVFDVSGAGDTAIATFALAIGAGADPVFAVKMANAASGVVVGKSGTSTLSFNELREAMLPKKLNCLDKIVSLDECLERVEGLRKAGKVIGFTNGCFDCLHRGHLAAIRKTKELCDILIVAVNSDLYVRRHKGANRPIQDEYTRLSVLASLQDVDYVFLFNDDTAEEIVKMLHPDVTAKGGYSLSQWPEGKIVRGYGGKAVTFPRVSYCSTTELIRKMSVKV